ncbi:MAG TPA: phosphoribosylanthranilate isomerase [Gammaproteobacteria bacterium]|nr:phosphoribosylanthranilate isomerase [Gammaproteobacteria bacterium]
MHIKICCIGSIEEADLAIRYGATAVGLVSQMPSSRGVIPDDRIAEIAAHIPRGVQTFLLTSRTDPADILAHHRLIRPDALQLVDRIPPDTLDILRRELPGTCLVRVVHVGGPAAVAEARRVEPYCDALLLDSGQPDAPQRELGGTGRVHDWSISAEIVASSSIPVYLAGGLTPGNVRQAIDRVRPFGVDVCSSLRPHGRLEEELLAQFVAAAVR